MKKFKLFKLLALFVVLIASINTAWAVTYNPSGVAQQTMQSQQPAIQSHQMMHGGSTYQGKVYTPFSGDVPSEQGAAGSPARVSGPRKGRNPGDPTSDQKSNQFPVGEPWVMVFFALAFAGFITIRKHKLNQTTDMKKSTKYIATLVLSLTLGVGNVWADYLTNGQVLYADLTGCGNLRDTGHIKFRLRKGGAGGATVDLRGNRVNSGEDTWFWCEVPDEGYSDVQIIRCSSDYGSDYNYTNFFTYSSGKNCLKPSESSWSWTSCSWNTYGFAQGTAIYLKPAWDGGSWQSGSDHMVAYFYGGPHEAAFYDMTAVPNHDFYSITVPYDYARVVFCRTGSAASGCTWDNGQVYNKSYDQSLNNNNLFCITGWHDNNDDSKPSTGSWNFKLINVYFRSTNDKPWLTPYIHQWNGGSGDSYTLLESYNNYGTGKWWKAYINTTSFNKFHVTATDTPSSDACEGGNKTAEWNISAVSNNQGYQIHCRNDKTDLDKVFDNVANLTAPTVVVDYAEAGKTIMTLTGHITNFGYDINYVNNGYECGFTLIDSESNEVNYAADCVIDDNTGYFYKTITGLKEGETYTVKAWAKNGYAKGISSGVNRTMKTNGTVRVWVYNQAGYTDVYLHCWYTNNCSGSTHTDANVSEESFPGHKMTRLGTTNWWYDDVSYDYPRFLVNDGTETHQTGNKGTTDYRYFTNNGDALNEYTGSHPTAYYIESTIGTHTYYSNVVANTEDTMSFYAKAVGGTVKLIKPDGTKTGDLTSSLSFGGKDGAVFTATTTGTGLKDIAEFEGDYHLHCNATSENYLLAGRGVFGTSGTKFIKFETSALFDDTYNYYWVDWFRNAQSIVATIGNKYNDDLAGVIGADANAPAGKTKATGGNVRFSYNPTTNTFERAIIDAGNEAIKITAFAVDSVLVWSGSDYVNDAYTAARNFGDATNWMYSVKAKVRGTAHANIKSTYVVEKWLAENKKLIGGNKGDYYTVEIDYDFKTNRLIAAWTPGDEIDPFSLESNLMAIRTENGAPTVLNIQKKLLDAETVVNLTNVTKIYTVMEFTQASWTDVSDPYEWDGRRIDDTKEYCDEFYWLSLPYDCYVGDIFGIEGYGDGPYDKWMLQRYRGDKRAKNGWWAEIESWWENMARTDTLKAGEGYVLRVTNLNGEYGSGSAFADASGTNKLYLYFPSMRSGVSLGLVLDGDNKEATSMTSVIPSHICELWRGKEKNEHAGDPNYDRRVIDSNWNLIGSPSFNSTKITTSGWQTKDPDPKEDEDVFKPKETPLKYFYTWSIVGGEPKFAIQNAENYVVPATHAYLAQYAGTITWAPKDSENPLVELKAPKRTDEEGGDQTLKLVLMQDTVQADVTYVSRMAEGATEDYDLNLDLSKVMNAGKSNIYTFAGYYKMAGNCLPDTTSIVPVGVMIAQDGEYTFAMPEGTNGVGVVLVDEVANTRTNLALTDYTVTLAKGTIDGRFSLELSPIKTTPTDIDNIQGGETQTLKARKTIVDGVLYIVKDGQVFDARGNRVE